MMLAEIVALLVLVGAVCYFVYQLGYRDGRKDGYVIGLAQGKAGSDEVILGSFENKPISRKSALNKGD